MDRPNDPQPQSRGPVTHCRAEENRSRERLLLTVLGRNPKPARYALEDRERRGLGRRKVGVGNAGSGAFANKFAKSFYLVPLIFGYVPAFSLEGSTSDIAIAFFLIIVGTWVYSWLLSGIWLGRFRGKAANA